jgi:uncharacterized protein
LHNVPNQGTIVIDMGTIYVADVLFGKTRQGILKLLLNHPEESYYLRQIQRETGAGLGALQRELKQLSDAGIILRTIKGVQVHYQADKSIAVFSDLKNLINNEDPQSGLNRELAMNSRARIAVPREKLVEFSKRNHIRKLSLFGSVLRDDFRPESDVDVLVEFKEDMTPGFGIVTMEAELSKLLGRKVDLRTPEELSRYFRDQVVKEAEVQYDATR